MTISRDAKNATHLAHGVNDSEILEIRLGVLHPCEEKSDEEGSREQVALAVAEMRIESGAGHVLTDRDRSRFRRVNDCNGFELEAQNFFRGLRGRKSSLHAGQALAGAALHLNRRLFILATVGRCRHVLRDRAT